MNIKSLAPFLAVLIILLCSCEKEDIVNNKVPVAEAGESQIIHLQEEGGTVSTTLTGTGTDADGDVVAYIWSQVSGPDASEIVNNGAPVTDVKKLIAGTYLYQLMVVDNEGATGVDTVSIIVKGPEYITISLQPADNPDEVVIFGNSSIDETGADTKEIGAAAWTKNGNPIAIRGIFKFNLSSIPSMATIKTAKLSLYSHPAPINGHHSDEVRANSGSDNAMLIQRVTSTWSPQTLTFYNQPSSTNTNQVVIPSTNKAFLDLVDIDVTELVKDMTVSNANYGFFLKLQNETYYNSRIFATSEYSDAGKHPKLVIVYSK
ncbi:MAG: DNRLRE domain-containing protein [Chitinophagaceae bacterium]|nr:DNRLRE domain-containing protein [Chitinophagaceae bacterium]